MEKGYTQSTNIEPYPYRVLGTGTHSSLLIILRLNNNDSSDNYLCSGAVQGFKITFQSPNEQPQIWKSYFYVSPNHAAFFKISPELTLTLPSVYEYSPDVRQCIFNYERQLRFFRGISQYI